MSGAQLTPDQEFLTRLEALQRDAAAAARYGYAASIIPYAASQRPGLVPLLNRDAGFWNTVTGALQTASIVALGRIYDPRGDVHSASQLVKFVTKFPGIFSRAALAARKDLNFAIHAFEPKAVDFKPLQDALDEHIGLYNATIGPIRHQVFAHAGKISQQDLHSLFGKALMVDYERLSVFPLTLWDSLFQVYYNGARPQLQIVTTDLATLVADPVGEREITLEHRYALKDFDRFLQRLAD